VRQPRLRRQLPKKLNQIVELIESVDRFAYQRSLFTWTLPRWPGVVEYGCSEIYKRYKIMENYADSLAKSYWSDDGEFDEIGCLHCGGDCPHAVKLLDDGNWEASYHNRVVTIPHTPIGIGACCLYSVNTSQNMPLNSDETNFWSSAAKLYREIPLWMLEAKYGVDDLDEDLDQGVDDLDDFDEGWDWCDGIYEDLDHDYDEEEAIGLAYAEAAEKPSYISPFTGKKS